MKYFNKNEKHCLTLNTIEMERWLDQYNGLWFNPEVQEESIETVPIEGVDPICMKELEHALAKTKNRKSEGPDGIVSELIIYGGLFLRLRICIC